MDKDFSFKDVPYGWALCFLTECPRKDECLRNQIYVHAAQKRTLHPCVMPGALLMDECPHFHPIHKVQMAAGFQNIFSEIKEKDLVPIRTEMKAFLGSRATFYRCKKGEHLLTPRQQKWIKEMLQRRGYPDTPDFDSYKETYLFL